jgi:hypothetical protein
MPHHPTAHPLASLCTLPLSTLGSFRSNQIAYMQTNLRPTRLRANTRQTFIERRWGKGVSRTAHSVRTHSTFFRLATPLHDDQTWSIRPYGWFEPQWLPYLIGDGAAEEPGNVLFVLDETTTGYRLIAELVISARPRKLPPLQCIQTKCRKLVL